MSETHKRFRPSHVHPLYLESEVQLSKSGAKFVPYLKTALNTAIREGMKQVLESLSKHSTSFNDMD